LKHVPLGPIPVFSLTQRPPRSTGDSTPDRLGSIVALSRALQLARKEKKILFRRILVGAYALVGLARFETSFVFFSDHTFVIAVTVAVEWVFPLLVHEL
jgi:hypothetical protein